nr:efflux transporter outer membrane subunit [Achromobacter aloeverae]
MLATGLLSGCVSLAPEYRQPPLPVRASWDVPAAPGDAVATLGWSDYFGDPRLRALIENTLANNRDLRIAAARVEQARAAYGIQRADLYPWFAAGATGTRQRVPGDLNLSGQPQVSSQYQVALGMSEWELDLWGRVRDLSTAALQDYFAADDTRRAATLSLINQTAQNYLGLRDLQERLDLARQTVATRAESLRIFELRHRVGSASKLELTETMTLWQQARALVTQLEQQRAAQAHALELLTGSPVPVDYAQGPGDDEGMMRDLAPGLPSALLENRPDIVAAEHQLKGAHASIGAARAAFFPRIALTGAAGTASADLDGLFKGGSGMWTFTPSITLPIFQGGALRNNLDLAQARRVEAVAQYEKTIQAAFRDVADALSARDWLARQVEILGATHAAQAERARLAKLRYDHGSSSFLEVLDAQRDLLAVQQQEVESRYALLISRANLYAALGGGSLTLAPADAATPADGGGAGAPPDAATRADVEKTSGMTPPAMTPMTPITR